MAFVLLCLGPTSGILRVVFLSDLHVGEACLPIPYNGSDDCACIINDKRAIAFINTLDPQPDAVIITGDITSSAWPTQMIKALELLSTLSAPFFPLMGNHDVWSYDREGGNETAGPFGDALFGEVFGHIFLNSPLITGYENVSVHNPLWNTTSTFQNWQLTLQDPDTGKRLAFVAGDWSTREPAPPPDSGVPGWAERGLSNFPGGTLPWFTQRLREEAASPQRADKLFLVQHQPISCPWYIPDFLFCFGAADKELIEKAMLASFNKSDIWGVFAGHNHQYFNQSSPFWDWPEFREFEFSATKGDGFDVNKSSAFTIVEFVGTDVSFIEEHWFELGSGWHTRRGD